ncbi:TspO/MBR family protein [Cyanobium gracile UHCC 0139]|uniref:TspO/MBR family protein n=1 Tax=Cyanobium gracile UHCC 0139 TaxID=3110308 RepID=A0ABU5RSV1_9CYAN|nr:TspO/MBR family protein [Cyanobium gracile]MEA5390829.1 TspO/MBR family protein [Cyanobium gracile UHCC 0139]
MPPWLLILITVAVITLVVNPTERDYVWYRSLRRPAWISRQAWVALVWPLISVGFYGSALAFWQTAASWGWVAAYAVLLVLLRCPRWLSCRLHNLSAGLPLWLLSWTMTLVLALIVRPASPLASWLLLPVLLWLPVEAAIALQMVGLNRKEHRSGRGPDDRRPARSRRL